MKPEHEALKDCPFCGGEAAFGDVAYSETDPNSGGEFIDCSQCQASTALVFPLKGDVKRELSERWNRRALSEAPDAKDGERWRFIHARFRQYGSADAWYIDGYFVKGASGRDMRGVGCDGR